MPIIATMLDIGAFAARELALFAACGFLVLGIGDLVVDAIWIGLRLKRLARGERTRRLVDLPAPTRPGQLIVFIPAWDESAVIGAMLRHASSVFRHDDVRLYVGCYPNDPATIRAAGDIDDPRIRLVINPRAGPTSKADGLNSMWSALLEDERREDFQAKAVILHDAEDVVHSCELEIFDSLIERFGLVQLPVIPLLDRHSTAIECAYGDEFAEQHTKEMVVREAIGAGLPSAGVGCAISRDALMALAAANGQPFDADSLTEDYELGLKLRGLGFASTFARVSAPGGGLICARAHFPRLFRNAVAQKARWIAGIALSGWDRLGWQGGLAERWMRLRDRQSLVAALLLFATYVALLITAPVAALADAVGHPVVIVTPLLAFLAPICTLLLIWRGLMRFVFATRCYGPIQGLLAVPRLVVSNAVAIVAARDAIGRYRDMRRTGTLIWGKTDHIFPASVPAE